MQERISTYQRILLLSSPKEKVVRAATSSLGGFGKAIGDDTDSLYLPTSANNNQVFAQKSKSNTPNHNLSYGTIMAQSAESKPIVIFVTGETGVGKSTFIRHTTGLDVKVSDKLEACKRRCASNPNGQFLIVKTGTQKVQLFQIPGTNVYLADSPGFGDTYRNDASILAAVDSCLADTFKQDIKLAGVLFLHSLLEARMKSGAMKNLLMFKKMVGAGNLHKCRLITTKWSLQDRAISEQRETELRTNPNFWKPLIERGAQIDRFGDSMDSAIAIIRPLLEGPGVVLQLTKETQVKGLKLEATDAGKEVNEDLQKAKEVHLQELADLEGLHEVAMAEKDKELAKHIKEQEAKVEAELKQLEEEKKVLREGLKSSGGFWGWVVRGVALTVGIGATILTDGALAPAAVALLGHVEAVIQART
jgi:energy-coupling factor transporter ATP-binding protein EcfA2